MSTRTTDLYGQRPCLGAPLTSGSTPALLLDGEDVTPALWRRIQAAERAAAKRAIREGHDDVDGQTLMF